MAIESSSFESASPELITMHKQEEEPDVLPPPTGYTYDPNELSDDFGSGGPQNSSSLSDASGSPCSSPLSLASCSLDGCSSSSSPGPHDSYREYYFSVNSSVHTRWPTLTVGFPEYGGYLPGAPMQVLDYGSTTYQDAIAAPAAYNSYEPYSMDGYMSTGSSSASSTPPSEPALPMTPYTLDGYSTMTSAMPGDCNGHVSYDYQIGPVSSDWSHPSSGGFTYVPDDCPPALGMRY